MRAPVPLLAALLIGRALADEPTPGVEAGLNIAIEATAGLRGGAQTGKALQALTIAHATWQRAQTNPDAAILRSYASALNHEGSGPTERFLGDFLAASNIEAHNSTRLYSWWLEIEQASWSVRTGALLADEEFTGTEAGGLFLNSAFGWPAFISANTVNTGPAFYVAAPGLRLAHVLSPSLTWRTGLYDGDSFDSPAGDPAVTRDGLHYRMGGEQGWFAITELSYAPEGGPTRLKAGVWHHTARFADSYFDAAGEAFATSGRAPREHSCNGGGYLALERTLAGEPGKPGHTDFFARLGGAPDDRNALAWSLDTGLAWTGPVPARPKDVLALGFVHAEFSRRFAATAHLLDPTAPRLDAEQVLELSYTLALGRHFSCKPDLQFIRQPGGSRANRDAVFLAVRLIADF